MHILPVVLDRKSTRCQQDDIFGICQSSAWHGFPLPPLFQVCSSQQCLCGAKCLVKHLTSMMYNHATPPLFLLLLVRVFQKKCMCYSDCSAVCLWTGETKKKKKNFWSHKEGWTLPIYQPCFCWGLSVYTLNINIIYKNICYTHACLRV